MKYFAILQAAGAARNIETTFKPFKVDVHTKAISKKIVHDQCDQESFTFILNSESKFGYINVGDSLCWSQVFLKYR